MIIMSPCKAANNSGRQQYGHHRYRPRHFGFPCRQTGQDRGEMYLRIAVHVPEQLSSEERELYEQLRAIGGKQGWNFKKMWK